MIHIRSTQHHKRDAEQRPPKQLKRPRRQKAKQHLCSSIDTMDRPAQAAGQSEHRADHSTPKSEPFAPCQETLDNAPTPMDEGNVEKADIFGEDLVDYGASPEHAEN
jgi:hypothetical protein